MSRLAVKIAEAAEMVSQSPATIRRAIKATRAVDDEGRPVFPPPLKAKKGGKGEHLIDVREPERWFASLPDA